MFGTIWQIDHVPQSLHSRIWPLQNLLVIGDSWQGFSCYGEQSLTLLESLVESHGKLDTEEWLLALCQQGEMILSGRTPNKSVFLGTCDLWKFVHVSIHLKRTGLPTCARILQSAWKQDLGSPAPMRWMQWIRSVILFDQLVRSDHSILSYHIISYHDSRGFWDDRHHGHHVFNCVSRRRTADGKVIEAERKWSMPLSGPWRHGSIKAGWASMRDFK